MRDLRVLIVEDSEDDVLLLLRELPAEHRPTTIVFDLQGPKLRVGHFKGGEASLEKGQRFTFDRQAKEGDGKRVELEKLREELEKKGALLTADVRRDKQEQFERKRRDAARLADDFQKELERKESQLLQKVLAEVSGIIEKLGKDRGYYLIVEKRGAGVIYASTDADVTDEIIRAYDQQSGPKGGGKKP